MIVLDDEILKSAKITVRSGAFLTVGRIISTLISFTTMIFVIRLLGEEQYGLYGLVLVPISMIMLFRDWGIPPALTKYVAWFKTRNRIYEIKKLIILSLFFTTSIGIILTIITSTLATSIAVFYRKPEVAPLIRIVSLVLLAGAIYNVAWNVFLGFEDTKYNAAMLVINAIMKGGLALVLVLLGYGVLGAIIGYVIGFFASAILGILFIPGEISKYRGNKSNKTPTLNQDLGWWDVLRVLLGFGFPLAVASIIAGFGKQFYSFIAGRYCSKWDFGNYSAATTLLTPLPILAMPISTVLFPAYSKINGVKERKLLDSAFRLAVKYVSLLIVPVAALIMGLSEPLKEVLFGKSFPDASFYLVLLAAVYLYTTIGYLNLGPLLSGQGYTKTVMIANLLGLLVGIPVSFLVIPLLGIVGLILTNIVVASILTAFFLVFIKKKLGITVEWECSIKILLAGCLSGFVAYFLRMWINGHPIVELLIGGFVGLGVYIFIVLITRALTMEDIRNLKVIFGSIHPLKRVLKPHARKIEEILKKILE